MENEEITVTSTETPEASNVNEGNHIEAVEPTELIVDEETGEQVVDLGDDTEKEVPAEDNSTAAEQTDIKPAEKPAEYTEAELIEAIQNDSIDQSRVSASQAATLKALNKAFVARQQADLQQQQQLDAIRNKQIADDKINLDNILGQAKELAMKESGLSADDMESIEFMDDDDERKQKYNSAVSRNIMQLQEQYYFNRFNAQLQQKEFIANNNKIRDFCSEQISKNAEMHDKVLNLLDERIGNMPYNIAVRLEATKQNIRNRNCTPEDVRLFQEAYNETKKLIEQKERGITKVPKRASVPAVEGAGTSAKEGKRYDLGKLDNMTNVDRMSYIQSIIQNSLED